MTRKQYRSVAPRKALLIPCAAMLTANLTFAGSSKMSKDPKGKNPFDLVLRLPCGAIEGARLR